MKSTYAGSRCWCWPSSRRRGSSAAQQAAPRLTGGNGTLYIGGYPNVIWIIDEATEKVTGTIQTKTGIPRRLMLSRDLKRFYNIDATNEHVEIIDIASRTTIDSFRLTEGNKRVRIASLEPDPQHRYLMMITRAATKLRDRVEIGPSQLQQFDLKERKIIRTVPWPDGQERDQGNLMFSPDGKLLYFLGERDSDLRNGKLHAGRQVGSVELRGRPRPGERQLRRVWRARHGER